MPPFAATSAGRANYSRSLRVEELPRHDGGRSAGTATTRSDRRVFRQFADGRRLAFGHARMATMVRFDSGSTGGVGARIASLAIARRDGLGLHVVSETAYAFNAGVNIVSKTLHERTHTLHGVAETLNPGVTTPYRPAEVQVARSAMVQDGVPTVH